MGPNPVLGVMFHWIGGLAAASFYVPYKGIRLWSWEVFWLVGGIVSWLVAPWLFAALNTNDLLGVLGAASATTWFWCYFWGAMWGLGGLTFGLTLRYLGISLGMAVALGLTTVVGTLGPPIYRGELLQVASTFSGQLTLLGILVTLFGIAVVAQAGRAKEQESSGQQDAGVREFNLRKGIVIALFSGVMSGCFAWGLAAGQEIRDLSLAAGTGELSHGLPVLCVVLLGGLTTNVLWCGYLIVRNGSFLQLIGRSSPRLDDGRIHAPTQHIPLLANYALASLGGAIWYFQFFFYTMGESQMGEYGFSSWTLHMASIILFSTLWGFALREWKNVRPGTRALVVSGIGLLVGSTVIIGLGNMVAS